MNKLIRPATVVVFTILLALSFTVIAFSTNPPALKNGSGTGFFAQTTPTPPVEEDRSEVGSTDEIIVMGGVIATIVLIPILLQRKAWMQEDHS